MAQKTTHPFDPKKTVYLIDGSSFLYRAYYSLPPLTSSSGEQVSAVFGFCRMIKRLLDMFKPDYIAVVWDSKGGSTARKELFAEYKATRQAPPSDLFVQKEKMRAFLDAIGLTQIETPGIEADDIMYAIAKEREQAGDTVVLVTSDKDMGQVLSDQVFIYDSFKDLLLDQTVFAEKMGFPVDRLVFYFSLLGDTSDNIPGVRGIGKQGALELVSQFSSLSQLYENLDQVTKTRMRTALEANRDNAFLSEKLFRLLPYQTGLNKEQFAFNTAQWAQAKDFFVHLGFKSLINTIAGGAAKAELAQTSLAQKREALKKYSLRAVTMPAELDELCVALREAGSFAIDTETVGTQPLQDKLVGISVCMAEGTAYYIPFDHEVDTPQLSQSQVFDALKPILEDARHKKYLHYVKFDELVLAHAGIRLAGVAFDSLVAAHLLAKEGERVGLKFLSQRYFNEQMLTFDDVVKQQKYKNFSQVPIDLAADYAAFDAHQTYRLTKLLQKELAAQPTLQKLYDTIEFPLIAVLIAMEAEGIPCDPAVLKALDVKVMADLQLLHDQIIGIAGEQHAGINLNSPKQIERLLFHDLQLPPQKKSSKGGYSTDQEVLLALSDLHPIPGLILRYRELAKLKSTYIDALPTYLNPETGCIHTTYMQTAVATGRLASVDPNLQNIPADASGYGIEIRAAFKPKVGHVFISADYSQIELRVLAELSQDEHLIQAFLQGHDIHAETSARLFGVPLDQVSHEQRQIGKRINFSILYGLTPYGLSKDLQISFAQAKKYIDTYFEQYPGVSAWMEQVVATTHELGYVTTYWGRRRYIPGIYEKNKALYEEAKRIAVNTKAQGTAAEIMKLGMINLHAALWEAGLRAKILLNIHDELLLTVPQDEQEAVVPIIKKTLEGVVAWQVPLAVTIRVGKDWKEVTK